MEKKTKSVEVITAKHVNEIRKNFGAYFALGFLISRALHHTTFIQYVGRHL